MLIILGSEIRCLLEVLCIVIRYMSLIPFYYFLILGLAKCSFANLSSFQECNPQS